LVAAILVAAPAPARADPATPTNYLSEVTSFDPPTGSVHAEIRGGDAFLHVEIEPGTEVVVLGYEGEPYLRIDPEGLVWNYLNDDRFAQINVPPSADAGATPAWTQVGDGGQYGWHDHRTHWMPPDPPIGVDQETVTHIQDWTVVLAIRFEPSASVLMIVGGLSALIVGSAQTLASPLGLGGEVLAWLPGFLVLVAGVVSIRRRLGLPVVGGSAVVMGMWCVSRLATLWMPVLPTGLPEWVERSAVVLAAACAVGLGAIVFRSFRGVTPSWQS
jgi:hypothetical protein